MKMNINMLKYIQTPKLHAYLIKAKKNYNSSIKLMKTKKLIKN